MMDAKERLLMNQTCSSVIRMDRQIKFVCIVDENAKLLVGQSRDIPSNIIADTTTDITKSSAHITNSEIDDLLEVHFKYKRMYPFYSDYLLWVIENCRVHLDDTDNKNDSYITQSATEYKISPYFEISGCNSERVKLVATPLNVKMRTYLCIYFEPAFTSKSSASGANEGLESLLHKIYLVTLLSSRC
jgi:hypothetical protein